MGGLRSSIGDGKVTMGSVITVLPFQNTLATFQLKGSDVKAALENGLSQIDDGAGRFPQVSGIKYTFDRSKPAGSRLGTVEVKEGGKFVAIDPEKTYNVVTNNYMRAGGDGYSVFAKNGKNAYDYGPDLADVTADYIAAHAPTSPTPTAASRKPRQLVTLLRQQSPQRLALQPWLHQQVRQFVQA